METVIDALTVTLGLDATKFKQGHAETEVALKRTRTEAQRTAKGLEEHGKQAAMFFSNIRNEALSLIGVLAGSTGLGLTLKNTADGLVKLQFAATNIGIDPSRLQAIDRALNRNGASADAASTALQNYAQQALLAKLGQNPGFIGALAPIGGNINDSGEQFLLKAQQYVADHLNNPQLIQTVLGRLGLGQDTINSLIRIGSVGKLNEEIAYSLQEIGTASKEQIEAADKFQHGMRDFEQSIDQLQTVILGLFGGPLGDFLEWLAKRHPEFADAPHNTLHPPPHGPVVTPGGWWDRNMPSWLGGSSGGTVAPGGASPHRLAFIRDALSKDLNITPDAAAGIVSNLNAESGLQGINERNPKPGTRGGFGWAQWTGPRRDAFEAYARAHFLPVESDAANYGFLVEELRTRYPGLLAWLGAGNITADQAANLAFQYESGGDPGLEKNRAGHVGAASRIAALPSPGTPLASRPSVAPALGALTPAPAERAAPYAPGAFPGGPNSNWGTAANTTTVSIGNINVNAPQAKDASGIASGIGDALSQQLVTQANRGQW
jgi:hypothetical protein